MKNQDRLAKNAYISRDAQPHIVLSEQIDTLSAQRLIQGCPASLYYLDEQGKLQFNPHGCLECGTCRLLCDSNLFERWEYPEEGAGVVFRYG